jgi:hypothetical protein
MLSLPSPAEPMQPGQQRRVLAIATARGHSKYTVRQSAEQPSSRELLRNFRGMPEETRNPLTLAFPPSLRHVPLHLHVHASTTAHTPSVTAHGPPSGAIHGPPARPGGLPDGRVGTPGSQRGAFRCYVALAHALHSEALGFSAHNTTSWSIQTWAPRLACTRRKKLGCR